VAQRRLDLKPRESSGVSTLFYLFLPIWREKKRRMLNIPVKLVLTDIENMLEHYYIPYLTSLKVASSKFPPIPLAQRSLSSGVNQPNEPGMFQFFSRIY